MNNFTRILSGIENGNLQAADELLPLVYEELRKLAAARMVRERSDQTLQPTALVHEAWLRLVGNDNENVQWSGRAHFFGAAAEAMRRILVDRARRKKTIRHGGGLQRMDLQDADVAAPSDDEQMLALNDALEKLAARDKLKADLVKLRYFTGLTLEETARTLGISEPTAKRYWTFAKAWLYQELHFKSEHW